MTVQVAAPTPAVLPDAPAGETLVDRHFLHRGHGAEFEMEVDWVRSFLPVDAGRVLDVGCGSGALLGAIGKDRALGIDYCAQGLSRSSQMRGDVPVACADATRTPFADRTMQAITAQHVIEHMKGYEAALREWRRLLSPGGVLLILTPNVRFVDPSVFDDDTHVHLFDHVDLARTLSRTGFEIINLCTLGLPWFRDYQTIPLGWRFRRFVTRRAQFLAKVPCCRWRGQTLCAAARRPTP